MSLDSNNPVDLLSIVEAATVSGSARVVLDFLGAMRRQPEPLIAGRIATFCRGYFTAEGTPPNGFVAAAQDLRIPVEIISESRALDLSVVGALRALVRARQPQIVETHSVKGHFLARLAGVGKGQRWIAFHHGYTLTDLKMRAYNRLDRFSLRGADCVVTVSRAFAAQLIALGVRPERVHVLHNAIDAARFARLPVAEGELLRREHGILPGEKVILAIGRLSAEKGHADLVRAFAQLRSQLQIPARLLIAGDGPERARLEALAKSCGVSGHVVFAGQVADVLPYYAAATVMALPSLSEGSPNVLLEAMAAGVPCLATRVGGVPEIATDRQDSLLVPARDTDAMADALGRLLSDPGLCARLVSAARRTSADRHRPEVRSRALIDIYREVAGLPRLPERAAPAAAA